MDADLVCLTQVLQLSLTTFFRPSMVLLRCSRYRRLDDDNLTRASAIISSMPVCGKVSTLVVRALGVAEGAASVETYVETCVFVKHGG